MPIYNMDDLIAGFQDYGEDVIKSSFTAVANTLHSSLYVVGRPGAAVTPTPGMAGTALTTYAGQIPVPAPVAGQNIYLARFECSQAGNIGSVTLMDRLWHNSGITITTTTAQTVNSVALPARDQDGSTNGNGIMIALEGTATVGNAAITNTTVSYTNSLGTAGRTATLATPAAMRLGTFVPFYLQAGDLGIRSIQSITLGTSYVSGSVSLVMYRELASMTVALPNATSAQGPIELGLPRLYDNAVPFLVFTCTSAAPGVTNSQITYAQR
jgi:hypothetical protein